MEPSIVIKPQWPHYLRWIFPSMVSLIFSITPIMKHIFPPFNYIAIDVTIVPVTPSAPPSALFTQILQQPLYTKCTTKQPAKMFVTNQLSPTLTHLMSYFSHLHLIPSVFLAALHDNFSSFHIPPAPKPP
jgi:hypothetical protein